MKRIDIFAAACLLMATSVLTYAQATNTFPATGNVGIGTTSPSAMLQLNEPTADNATDLYIGQPISNINPNLSWALTGVKLAVSTVDEGANVSGAINAVATDSGTSDLGGAGFLAGATNPAGTTKSNVIGSASVASLEAAGNLANAIGAYFHVANDSSGNITNAIGVQIDSGFLWGQGGTITNDYGLQIADQNAGQVNYAIMTGLGTVSFGDRVGIGTTTPGAALEVNGNIKMTYNQSSPTSLTFSDGSIQTTAYTGVICGGDFAESVDVSGDRKKYEPGDVLVIDPDKEGNFLKSAEAYSTSVTGIYSTKPGTVGRRQTTPKSADEVPMAMVGIVPTKVIAENGPIRPGDLLVTSSKLGYAMKGTDRSRMLGAVIGKALGSLDKGTGVIEVVVTLQ